MTAPIFAAGGVVWRRGTDGPEIAVVHRPKYDDWSLPKGKLHAGEHVLLGAVREVLEETGQRVRLGRPLGRQSYGKRVGTATVPKLVDFWAMATLGGPFVSGDEVDELEWLTPGDASRLITLARDRRLVERFAEWPPDDVPVVLVRHASAGERADWQGADRDRPLDELGRRQADRLRPLLECFGVRRVHAADVVRCFDTVAPYAVTARVPVAAEPLLSEAGYAANAAAATERLLAILQTGEPSVVVTQGKVIPDLLRRVCRALGEQPPEDPMLGKGAFWVLHVAGKELAALERHDVAVDDPPIAHLAFT